MDTIAGAVPGAEVHTTDGIAGTVVDVVQGPGAAASLLVRAEDGATLYRVPVDRIANSKMAGGTPVVVIGLKRAALEEYRADRAGPAADPRDAADDTVRIPVRAEELVVEKRPVERGHLRLHKGVETIEQTLDVPIIFEEAVVERLSPDVYDGTPGEPDEIVIPVYVEQLVVEKRQVLKEYVRIRKRRYEQQQTVREPIRREYVEVLETPDNGVRQP